jgi:2-C-methyl-D-erythritol 4-phosphate cytidylyltransferase
MDVIILAAGSSERMGKIKEKNKVFMNIFGHPGIMYPIFNFAKNPHTKRIMVVYNPDQKEDIESIFRIYNFNVKFIEGGMTRSESVFNALKYVESDKVLIHDGARICIDSKTIKNVINGLEKYNAVIPGIKSTNTLKYIKNNIVQKTIDRNTVYQIQTPQGFKSKLLLKAIEPIIKNKVNITDDASAMEKIGEKVLVVSGNQENIKLTTQIDYMVSKAILYKRIKEKTENFLDKMRR